MCARPATAYPQRVRALDELPAHLAGTDYVVVPSQWSQAFVFAAREALALGVAVLASRVGALAEPVRPPRPTVIPTF